MALEPRAAEVRQPAMLGYCTNVHAGADLARTKANLMRHALDVRARVSPGSPMGIGLWLARPAARELTEPGRLDAFAGWLDAHGLVAFTLNGFPYENFHLSVVKHRVYQPDWTRDERLAYTADLARILPRLLGPLEEGSISTLPVGWGATLRENPDAEQLAARQFLRAVDRLADIEERTGKLIHLDLEPEPGCYLETSADVVHWFDRLTDEGSAERVLRYLRVCHDVCHAAVMFEDQRGVFEAYEAQGVRVGKVQLSSAVKLPLESIPPPQRGDALSQLAEFVESRYLHQTVIAGGDGGRRRFFEDLPLALDWLADHPSAREEWRVHYHVPLYLERIGLLETTQPQVRDVLAWVAASGRRIHLEAETYAWDVLPDRLRVESLAAGIAEELRWVHRQLSVSDR